MSNFDRECEELGVYSNRHTDQKLYQTGLRVHEECPFLGGSPDERVRLNRDQMPILEGMVLLKKKYFNNIGNLKRNHQYYLLIQGTMLVQQSI